MPSLERGSDGSLSVLSVHAPRVRQRRQGAKRASLRSGQASRHHPLLFCLDSPAERVALSSPNAERGPEPLAQNAKNGGERLGGAMEFTLSGAAREARVSKSTISAAIKDGRLSAVRQEDGSFRIDAAELSRAFSIRTAGTVAERPPNADETAVLRERVAGLEARLAEARETIADLRKSRDDIVAAFPRQIPPPDKPAPVTEPARRRWRLW